jgi:hypothetical protein
MCDLTVRTDQEKNPSSFFFANRLSSRYKVRQVRQVSGILGFLHFDNHCGGVFSREFLETKKPLNLSTRSCTPDLFDQEDKHNSTKPIGIYIFSLF